MDVSAPVVTKSFPSLGGPLHQHIQVKRFKPFRVVARGEKTDLSPFLDVSSELRLYRLSYGKGRALTNPRKRLILNAF